MFLGKSQNVDFLPHPLESQEVTGMSDEMFLFRWMESTFWDFLLLLFVFFLVSNRFYF